MSFWFGSDAATQTTSSNYLFVMTPTVNIFSITPYRQWVWWTKLVEVAQGTAWSLNVAADYDVTVGQGYVSMCEVAANYEADVTNNLDGASSSWWTYYTAYTNSQTMIIDQDSNVAENCWDDSSLAFDLTSYFPT